MNAAELLKLLREGTRGWLLSGGTFDQLKEMSDRGKLTLRAGAKLSS
jgi:hypothetical protein